MREFLNKHKILTRAWVAYLAAAVMLMGFPLASFAQEAVTADIKINGQDGTVTITNGTSWNYSWTSGGAAACQITGPDGVGGVDLSGNGGPIAPGHPWYPAVGGSTTLTLTCTNGVNTATDSATVTVVAPGGGGGGGAVTADIKINGQDGTVTITNGTSWNYSWTSGSAAACQIGGPDGVGGVDLSGNGGPIAPGHSWYPAVGGSTTLTLTCTNGVDSATDSATVNIVASGGGGGGAVTADIKINGQDGTVTITNGTSWNYSWTSGGAAACQITGPDGVGGVDLSGNGGPIAPGHPWYPAVGGSTTLTLTCTNGVNTATDSATVTVVAPGGGGGGGGGSSRPPTTGSVVPGQVLGAATVSNFCPYLTSYLRFGVSNDVNQVIRLQLFLRTFEGATYVNATGVFDQATLQAVHAFQQKYATEILHPWGITQSTGFVYIRTLGKINQILCGSPIPGVTPAKQAAPAKPVVDKEGGKETCVCPIGGKEGGAATTTVTTAPYVPIVGQVSNSDNGQNPDRGIAGALFASPQSFADLMQALYIFVLILIVLYIIGSVLENVLYKDVPENVRKRFFAKWVTILVGIILTLVGAVLLGEGYLVLPLLVTAIAVGMWIALYPKHDTIRTKAKTMWVETKDLGKNQGPVPADSGAKK